MRQDESYKDPAFSVMTMEILSNVLSRADNPGSLGEYVTEEIRELTGARCIVLIQCLNTLTQMLHRIVSVNPPRRRDWAESPPVKLLYEVVHQVQTARFWRGDEPPEATGLLQQEGFALSMVMPLNAGEFRVGALLLLGLPDEEHVSSALDVVNSISNIVALVLRNSFLFESQEQIIRERTDAVQKANDQLLNELTERKRVEAALNKLNEELEQRVAKRTGELVDIQRALMNVVDDLNLQTTELEQANARLLELDRLKSLFIASMSHELRTPLNSIIGFSSVVLNEWIGPVNAEQKENLAIVLRSGKHLLNLINDVIDVSKIEAGKIESFVEDFDLHELIDEAVSLIKKDLEEKKLSLRVEEVRQQMCTDRRRLLQCVLNLLSNAVKFTDQGGISIETRVVQPASSMAAGSFAEICVTDTGFGISEEDQLKMFQPFVRVISPLRATIPGTGLGLYLSRKLAVEVLKGDIILSSQTERGSSFTIRIPVRLT